MASRHSRREVIAASLALPLVAHARAAQANEQTAGANCVACFSRSGNTKVVADQIARAVGAARFAIKPAESYPDDYFETVAQAKAETERGYRPPLADLLPNPSQLTTLFLAFPIWGMTAPPVIRSFLAAHDFGGTTIVPLITHGGYGLGNSLEIVASHARGATIAEGFSMEAPQERQIIERVMAWLEESGRPR